MRAYAACQDALWALDSHGQVFIRTLSKSCPTGMHWTKLDLSQLGMAVSCRGMTLPGLRGGSLWIPSCLLPVLRTEVSEPRTLAGARRDEPWGAAARPVWAGAPFTRGSEPCASGCFPA